MRSTKSDPDSYAQREYQSAFFTRKWRRTCTRIAEARPASMPRSASIRAASAFSAMPSSAAISRNARQNSSSSETLVRWPRRVSECLTGRALIAGHAGGRCPHRRMRRFPRDIYRKMKPASVILAAVQVEDAARLFGLRLFKGLLRLGPPEARGVLIGAGLVGSPRLLLAHPVQIDRPVAHFGPIMSSGRTTVSKVSASTKPSAIASSFSVVPFLCAVLATLVALS